MDWQTLPELFIPDEHDKRAAALITELAKNLPDESYSAEELNAWNAQKTAFENRRASDPAFDAAVEFIKSNNFKNIAEIAAGEASPAVLAKMMSVVKVFKAHKIADNLMKTPSSNLTYDRLTKEVSYLDVSAGTDKSVFYSGKGAKTAAEQFAQENSLRTLEQTNGGKWLNDINLFNNTVSEIDNAKALNIWDSLSSTYANNARGVVKVIVNEPRSDSIFLTTELPKLLKNTKVSEISVQSLKGKSISIPKGTHIDNALKMLEGF